MRTRNTSTAAIAFAFTAMIWPTLLVSAAAQRIGVKTLFVEPGSPWENGNVESFNGKLRCAAQRRDLLHAERSEGAE